MISQEEIKSFLEGNDPEEHIVCVEFDYAKDCVYKIKEIPGQPKTIQKDTFIAFSWVGDLRNLNFYQDSKGLQKESMTKYGIVIEKLETQGNDRLEKGLKFMVKSLKGYRSLIQFFRDGGLDPWSDRAKDKILILPPVEQYLISKEKRLFKGYEEYNDVTRLVFDLETTSLEPKDGRIFMIGIKTNKGYKKVIECSDAEQERQGLIEFFNIIDDIKPSITGGYNSANFDWYWIFERCKALNLDIKKICRTLNPGKNISQSESMLKLANEVEKYNQVSMWGYNTIDIIHAVRRAQAINSGIKSAGLKYITQYIRAEAADRVYIEHTDIGKMYAQKEEYWLNVQNGNYKKASEYQDLDVKYPGVYKKITGDKLVEMYLDDDLDETLKVDQEFNQSSFLLASMIPTTYERVSTMGTASIWRMLMLAWSYKHKLSIPSKQQKRKFVGGLSRLLKVGYSKDILKLDFSSLYPSIQLSHDIFPECDIMGVMKGMLSYFRETRIKYKNLSGKYKNTDKKLSQKYDTLQLPIKIFINGFFGSLSAPHVFNWGDVDCGEQITCTGRQYLRQMVKFFMKKGYTPMVLDTDGCNFSLPIDGVDNRIYIGKGNNWLVEKGKEYSGYDADVAEFNDIFMKNEMGLDCDGTWASCINLARKNYATLEHNGKVKLTGNSIKSKKLPLYIEDFLDVAVKLLLEGKGKEFVEYYYEYLQKIYDKQIPLMKIAQRAKVKLTVEDYKKRSTQKTKSGGSMSAMAHIELAIRQNMNINLGDVIYYVNNGTKSSQGDIQKITKPTKKMQEEYMLTHGKPIPEGYIQINCYMLEQSEIESNPNMTGEYNVPSAITTFNKRIEPLLVVFKQEIRDNLLVDEPKDRGIFTTEQCELISGVPFEERDQDRLQEDLLDMSVEETIFWEKKNIDPNYIYELSESEFKNYIN
jgi:DNA polymerase elongation subunit (family B)